MEFHNKGVVCGLCQNLVPSLHSETVLAYGTRDLLTAKANRCLLVFILLELLTTLQSRPSIPSFHMKPNLCILKPLGFLYLSLMSDSWSFVDSSSSHPAQTCSSTSFPSSAGTNTKSPKGSMSSFLDPKSCQFHLLDMFHIYSLYPIPTVFALVQVLMMSSQDYNIPLFFLSLTWSSQFSLHLTQELKS